MSEVDRRYERQVLLPEIGVEGQIKLASSSVLVVGAGGLGAPVLQYLAAAGVGHIGIIDGDVVSESNLNRQILYSMQDIGKPKALLAAGRLECLNAEIKITAIPTMLTDENAAKIINDYDMLALCTDSLEARRVGNRACAAAGIPFVDGAVSGFHGTVMTIVPGETACYECIQGFLVQPKGKIPILGAMAAWIGCAEALSVIRLLLGADDFSRGAVLFFDGKEMSVERVLVEKSPGCMCNRHSALN